jgi:hypothetical protein
MKKNRLQALRPNFLKRVTCYFSVVALLTISPVPLLAAEANPESDWVGESVGILQGLTNTYMQHQNQMHKIRMEGAMMAGGGATIPAPQFGTKANFFPHCMLPPQTPQIPRDQCEEAPSPGHANMMKQMAGQAQVHVDFHKKLATEGITEPYPHGITCLNNGLKRQIDAIDAKINQLKMMEATIAAQKNKFENDAMPLLDEMKKATRELDGGDPKLVDHSQAFKNKGCPSVLAGGAITPGKGLTDVQQIITGDNKKGATLQALSSDMLSSKAARLEADLKKQIEHIRSGVENKGIDGYLSEFDGKSAGRWQKGGQLFTGLYQTVGQKKIGIEKDMRRIRGRITKLLGSDHLPPLDSHFNSQVADFAATAASSLKQGYVNQCVTSNKNGMVGMPSSYMSGRFEQRGNSGMGNAVSTYQQRFNDIMSGGGSLEEKLAEVKFLECRYAGIKSRSKCDALPDSKRPKNITLRLNREYGGRRATYDYSPYELYQTIIGNCEKNYTASGKQANVNKAIEYINEAKNIGQRFNQELEEDILDKVLNCNGGTTDAGSCKAKSFDANQPDFCISKAKNCATNVKSCLQEINKKIKRKKADRKMAAEGYNQAVRNYSNWQKAFFQQKLGMVMADANFFQQYFPGSSFQVPTSGQGALAIADPKLASPNLGGRGVVEDIKLLGGGDFEFHNNLPKALDQLQKMLAGQKKQIEEGTVKGYISKQKTIINKNMAEWSKFAGQCKSVGTSALAEFKRQQDAQQEKMKEQQKEQQKQAKENRDFCRRYNIFRADPICAGNYGGTQVATDSLEIADHFNKNDQDAMDTLGQFAQRCQRQNQNSEVDDDDPESLFDLCKGGSESIIKKLDDNFLSEDGKEMNKLESLTGKSASELRTLMNSTDINELSPAAAKNFVTARSGLNVANDDDDADADAERKMRKTVNCKDYRKASKDGKDSADNASEALLRIEDTIEELEAQIAASDSDTPTSKPTDLSPDDQKEYDLLKINCNNAKAELRSQMQERKAAQKELNSLNTPNPFASVTATSSALTATSSALTAAQKKVDRLSLYEKTLGKDKSEACEDKDYLALKKKSDDAKAAEINRPKPQGEPKLKNELAKYKALAALHNGIEKFFKKRNRLMSSTEGAAATGENPIPAMASCTTQDNSGRWGGGDNFLDQSVIGTDGANYINRVINQ